MSSNKSMIDATTHISNQMRTNPNATLSCAANALLKAFVYGERLALAAVYDIVRHPSADRPGEGYLEVSERERSDPNTQLVQAIVGFSEHYSQAVQYIRVDAIYRRFALANATPVRLSFSDSWHTSTSEAVYRYCSSFVELVPECAQLRIDDQSGMLDLHEELAREITPEVIANFRVDLPCDDLFIRFLERAEECRLFLEKEVQRATGKFCELKGRTSFMCREDALAQKRRDTQQIIQLMAKGRSYDQLAQLTGKSVGALRQIASRAKREGLLDS